MTQTYFITGTDTDVGKTLCAKALLQYFNKQGMTTLAYKPIAAGCEKTEAGLRNSDALILQKNSNMSLSYKEVNPIAFEEPIAPHIAAQRENKVIDINLITEGLQALQTKYADVLLVEGAGGWRLPINSNHYLSGWVVDNKMPVILVVGMKLGCLNHAILTYESILNDGAEVVGWIANSVDKNMPYYKENLAFLKNKINAPMIAEIPYLDAIGLNDLENQDLSLFVSMDILL